MNKVRLLPCTECGRHVRLSEAACPFCGASLGALQAQARPVFSRATALRGSRAAVFTLLAGSAGLSGCGGDDAGDGMQAVDAEVADASDGATHEPSTMDGAVDHRDAMAQNDAAQHEAPPPADTDSGMGDDEDAGRVPVAIYGGVFPDPKTRAKV
jgi:hypothetical protein